MTSRTQDFGGLFHKWDTSLTKLFAVQNDSQNKDLTLCESPHEAAWAVGCGLLERGGCCGGFQSPGRQNYPSDCG